MSIIAKVVDDNGYKLELIRPIRDQKLTIGSTVEIKLLPNQTDLIKLFDSLLDEETKNVIFDKINEGKKEAKKLAKV